jgi:multiple sugar transport system ATP-binding protein
MASIRFERVGKTYPNGHVAIRGLDLAIQDGELMVVVGPSGCGKSTFLRLLAGLEPITAGTLRIGDAIANDQSPQARNIAMVFQDYALYPTMTVRENLGFPLKMRRLSREESARRVTWAAELLDLGTVLDRLPRELSGGQRQRVAMGRALVREPSVFLLDEPLSNLDAKLRAQVRAEINDLQRRTGTTMVYVTHDQVEAMTLGQRIAVLNRGELEQVADPQTLYDAPATPFVAGFIGSPPMNLFEARLAALPGGDWSVNVGDVRVTVIGTDELQSMNGAVLASGSDTRLIAGIRPEHLQSAAVSEAGFAFTVAGSEYLGHETLIHGHPGTGDMNGNPWIVRLPGMRALQPGASLRLACPAAPHVRLFPGAEPSV